MSQPARYVSHVEDKVDEIIINIDEWYEGIGTKTYIDGFVKMVTDNAFNKAKVDSEEYGIPYGMFRTQILKRFATKIIEEISE